MTLPNENGQGDSALQHRERLNSAAPDLLEALRGLLMHFEGPNCLAMQADVPAGFYLAEVEKAKDAIEKATGSRAKIKRWLKECGHHYGYVQPIKLGLTMQG